MPTLHEFTFAELVNLDDGKIPAAFDTLLARILADMEDRPADNTNREVNLKVALVPIIDPDGSLRDFDIQFSLTGKVPKLQSKHYTMSYRKRAGKPTAVFSSVTSDGEPGLFDEEQSEGGEA